MTPKIFTEWNEDTIVAYIKDKFERSNIKKQGRGNFVYSDEDIQIRRDFILELFRRGYSKRRVRGYLMEKIGIATTTSYDWVNDAIVYLVDDAEETKEYYLNSARERLEKIITDALNDNEKKVAIDAQKELNKINGLHIDRHEINMENTLSFNFNDNAELN